MNIQISRITLSSTKPTQDNVYFKIDANGVFISKVARNDKIEENITLNISSQRKFLFQIWKYDPQKIVKVWSIEASNMNNRNKKFVLKDAQWTVVFECIGADTERHSNKQNKSSKENKTMSSFKQLKIADKKKNRNRSSYKEINIANLKKNKDKAGVKKALKNTIDYLLKQEKKVKQYEDYKFDELCYAKSAKLSPNAAFVATNKNESALFSEYGFTSTEFNQKFLNKQAQNVENEQVEKVPQPEKKKKAKVK